jgi:hypothetical protein
MVCQYVCVYVSRRARLKNDCSRNTDGNHKNKVFSSLRSRPVAGDDENCLNILIQSSSFLSVGINRSIYKKKLFYVYRHLLFLFLSTCCDCSYIYTYTYLMFLVIIKSGHKKEEKKVTKSLYIKKTH